MDLFEIEDDYAETLYHYPHDLNRAYEKYSCTLIKHVDSHGILIYDATMHDDVKVWHIQFLKQLGMCAVIAGSHTMMPLTTHPYICKGIIDVLAMAIMTGVYVFPQTTIFVTPCEPYFDCMNTMLHAARLRVAMLTRRCLSFRECARAYRLKTGCAKKIQRAWRRAIANPSYALCKKRLLNEFHDMNWANQPMLYKSKDYTTNKDGRSLCAHDGHR